MDYQPNSKGAHGPAPWHASRRVRALAGLNAALLLALGAVAVAPAARGQAPGEPRNAGRYIIVGGALNAGDANAAYIIDTVNAEMIAMRWNDSRRRYEGLGYRNLREDAQVEGVRR